VLPGHHLMDWQRPSGLPGGAGAAVVGLVALVAGLLIGSSFGGPEFDIVLVEGAPPDCNACGS
jgi:hypothetical protein